VAASQVGSAALLGAPSAGAPQEASAGGFSMPSSGFPHVVPRQHQHRLSRN
jgi:hypothetical protein